VLSKIYGFLVILSLFLNKESLEKIEEKICLCFGRGGFSSSFNMFIVIEDVFEKHLLS